MSFTITDEMPDRATYDRIFDEAWAYIGIERARLGDEALREGMWDEYEREGQFTRLYKKNNYVCGMDCYMNVEKDGETYMFYKQPTFGADATGSRSWFYEEDFQKVSKEWMIANNIVGFFVFHNPGSPAALAVQSIWGQTFNGVQYYTTPTVEPVADWGGDILNLPDTMRAFVSRITS